MPARPAGSFRATRAAFTALAATLVLGLVGAASAATESDAPDQSDEVSAAPEVSDSAEPTADAPEPTAEAPEATTDAPADDDDASSDPDPESSISLEVLINGVPPHGGAGVLVAAGHPVEWTYQLANTGDADFVLVSLSDEWRAGDGSTGTREVELVREPDAEGSPVPEDPRGLVLEPGDVLVATATDTAIVGQFEATATVTATPVTADGTAVGEDITATADSRYLGGEAGLNVVTTLDGTSVTHPPGPGFAVGQAITWTTTVTNTGNVPLANLALDERGGVGGARDVLAHATWSELAPGASVTSTREGLTAVAGGFASTATVTATSSLGGVSAADDAWYYGGSPALAVRGYVNGVTSDAAPGTLVAVGTSAETTVTVTNTGTTWLADLVPVATRTTAGAATQLQLTTTASGPLAPGATRTWTADGAAPAGQSEVAIDVTAVAVTAHGDRLAQQPASASTRTWFLAGDSGLAVVKTVNGEVSETAPGPSLPAGSQVTWSYAVTNTGALPLTAVRLRDVETTPNHPSGSPPSTPILEQEIPSIAAGETVTLTATGAVRAGAYRNTVTVDASNPGAAGGTLSAADEAFYTGGEGGLAVTKQVALADPGLDAGAAGDLADSLDVAIDQELTWRVVVSNTGETTLSEITVVDPTLGVTAQHDVLEPGEDATFDFTSFSEQDLVNVVTATALTPTGDEVSGEASATLRVTSDDAATSDVEDSGLAAGSSPSPLWWAVGALVVLLAAAGVTALVLRRRAVAAAGDGDGGDPNDPGPDTVGGPPRP